MGVCSVIWSRAVHHQHPPRWHLRSLHVLSRRISPPPRPPARGARAWSMMVYACRRARSRCRCCRAWCPAGRTRSARCSPRIAFTNVAADIRASDDRDLRRFLLGGLFSSPAGKSPARSQPLGHIVRAPRKSAAVRPGPARRSRLPLGRAASLSALLTQHRIGLPVFASCSAIMAPAAYSRAAVDQKQHHVGFIHRLALCLAISNMIPSLATGSSPPVSTTR